jgi:hypothetical protein
MDGIPGRADRGHRPRLRAECGVFFAFSSFVMKALARLQPAQGTVAMQSINLMAVTPAFMAGLSFGSDRRPRWRGSQGR